MRLLLAEDEKELSNALVAILKHSNYTVDAVYNGTDALDYALTDEYDGIILDIMMPGMEGTEVLKEIRAKGIATPVLFLTAKSETDDRIKGLDLGADDYIPKPFIGEEVIARVKAVLKRSRMTQSSKKSFGSMEIDFEGHAVYLAGQFIDLTPRDLSLLLFLAEHPNKTFTRDQLIEYVWGWEYEGSDRAVDLAVKRLRKALAKWPSEEGEIRTLRGLGYQFHVTSY